MRCPYCGNDDTQVKDSRPTEDSGAIRRRRVCNGCGGRFTTFERVQLRDLTVVKKSGRKVPFDREKLARSVYTALRKRAVETERTERMISGIVRQLESLGDVEVTSDQIGEYVMDGLKGLDDVTRLVGGMRGEDRIGDDADRKGDEHHAEKCADQLVVFETVHLPLGSLIRRRVDPRAFARTTIPRRDAGKNRAETRSFACSLQHI